VEDFDLELPERLTDELLLLTFDEPDFITGVLVRPLLFELLLPKDCLLFMKPWLP
jgi:hypothetical protein